MKVFGISVLLVVGAAFMFLVFPSTTTSTFSDDHQDIGTMAASWKLKDNSYNTRMEKMKRDAENVDLEDYDPNDPVPSSRANLRAGPIEHGTPLMPYIPNPGPPSPPGSTESP